MANPNYKIKDYYMSGPTNIDKFEHGWARPGLPLALKKRPSEACAQRHSCLQGYRAHAVERRQCASPQVLAGMRVTSKKLGLGNTLTLHGSVGL